MLFLVKNGVSEELAMTLDDDERRAWCIIFSQMDGGRFDFQTGEWVQPEAK